MKRIAVKAAVKACGGKLVKGGEKVEGQYYEFKAHYDDQEQIDSFINNNPNDIDSFYTDFDDDGILTNWFNVKGI